MPATKPTGPIEVSTTAVKALDSGHKSKVTISLDVSQSNKIRFRFGKDKPTTTAGTPLSPGQSIVLQDHNGDLQGELWIITTAGTASVDVDVFN